MTLMEEGAGRGESILNAGRTQDRSAPSSWQENHFGWNACSACLCPQAPHPHMERRYLIVPGIGSSRIYILDTRANPRQPKMVKVIEPEEFIKKTGYTSPHTAHCRPDGVYGSACTLFPFGRNSRKKLDWPDVSSSVSQVARG